MLIKLCAVPRCIAEALLSVVQSLRENNRSVCGDIPQQFHAGVNHVSRGIACIRAQVRKFSPLTGSLEPFD
jgi:hypothetical protein